MRLFTLLLITIFTSLLIINGNAGEKVKIGFIVKQPEEPWFQLEWKFADEAAKKYNFELIKIGAADGEKVLNAIDSLGVNGAQGFVICTPEVNLGTAIINRAKVNNLKVLAVDDRFQAGNGNFITSVPYLGISARKIGNEVGEILWKQLKEKKWNIKDVGVCVVTFDELDTIRQRTEGAVEKLVELGFPKEKIFYAPMAKVIEVSTAFDATNILLTQNPDVKKWLVCGSNDFAVLGAIRAMENRDLKINDVVGIGINGTDCITEFEKSQPTAFYGSILLSAREHGFKTAEMMYLWVTENQQPVLDTRTVGRLITRSNYKDVLKEEGITF